MIKWGGNDFIRKPFRQEEIFNALEKHLELRLVYKENEPMSGPSEEARPSAGLPASWCARLRQATIAGDIQVIEALIDEIAPEHPQLAQALRRAAYDFNYARLRKLAEAEEDAGMRGKPADEV
jgi:hypothetical protein